MTTTSERGNSVTKTAHKYITTHVRGWDVGVRVESEMGENDSFTISASHGSNNPTKHSRIAKIELVDGDIIITPYANSSFFNSDEASYKLE